jgi:hypothetical protein
MNALSRKALKKIRLYIGRLTLSKMQNQTSFSPILNLKAISTNLGFEPKP